MAAIDLNRGVTIRTTTDGIRICMYKAEPGVYLNDYGGKVSDAIAARAGFPVDELAKEKLRIDRYAQAKDAIDREFGFDGNLPEAGEVVLELGDFRVVAGRLGRHDVMDPDDNVLNPRPLTAEEASALAQELSGISIEATVPAATEVTLTEPRVIDESAPRFGVKHAQFGKWKIVDGHTGERVEEDRGWLSKEDAEEVASMLNSVV